MEKTLIIYIESTNQTWELPDDLVMKLEEYKTEHPIEPGNANADEIHQYWFDNLAAQEQTRIAIKINAEKGDAA